MGRLKKRKKREALEYTLNVTSLMDVLTVLLFFLIKSYSVSAAALQVPQGMRLPASTVKVAPRIASRSSSVGPSSASVAATSTSRHAVMRASSVQMAPSAGRV